MESYDPITFANLCEIHTELVAVRKELDEARAEIIQLHGRTYELEHYAELKKGTE